jgi:hypothetical protein
MYAELIGPTPRRCELNTSPIDAFVVAQETHPLALPQTRTVLNQQARHSFLRNHFNQNWSRDGVIPSLHLIEQTGNPRHQAVNLDIVILFQSRIHSALVNIAETRRGELFPAERRPILAIQIEPSEGKGSGKP